MSVHYHIHYMNTVVLVCQNQTIEFRINWGQMNTLHANVTIFPNCAPFIHLHAKKHQSLKYILWSLMYRLLNQLLVYLTTRGLWWIIGQRCSSDPECCDGATSSCPWGFRGQSWANIDPLSSSRNAHMAVGIAFASQSLTAGWKEHLEHGWC